jgi:hypothetical protein
MGTVTGAGELTKRRPLPEAAYCQPDERNRRLAFAGQCAAQIVWLHTNHALTPGLAPAARMNVMAAYACRIQQVIDLLVRFE